jgi:predicted nucleic acid-binding protein
LTEGVIVETNWILDIVLGRHSGAQDMWQRVREGRLGLFLPSICLAESVKVVERCQDDWRRVASQLRREASEIRRAGSLAVRADSLDQAEVMLAELEARLEKLFWPTLEQVSRRARLLEMGPGTVALAANIREFLGLSPADAAVLATVLLAKQGGLCDQFMSRDKRAFDTAPTRTFLRERGIAYYADPLDFLGALDAASRRTSSTKGLRGFQT